MKTKLVFAAALLTALASTSRSSAESAPSDAAQLRASLETMQKAMAQLTSQLQATQARLTELEKGKATAGATSSIVLPLDAVPTELAKVKDHQSINDDQAAAPRLYNYPLEAGLDGFMPVFNTHSVLKLGGSIRVDGITDNDGRNGNPNMWIPSSFVVNAPEADARTTMQAKASRLSLELRRPVGSDRLRIFYENDFYGNSTSSSMDYRLRHFYGQVFNLLVGQTYSTFQDVDAWPDTLDYEGPNGMVSRRQPQIRWTSPFADKHGSIAIALEQPSIDLSAAGLPAGASGTLETPDFTSALRFENPDAGHVQLAAVLREINYDRKPQHGSSALGWGLALSGAFNLGGDRLYGQAAYGEGIARYINDTGGLGLDAAVDPAGDFSALPTTGLVVGYTHLWGEAWRSSLSYGYVKVESEPSLGALALSETNYANLNLIWQPAKSLRVGVEGLYGKKATMGGLEHEGYRLNFVFKYDIVK